jgi:hypothetical protein
MELKFPGNQPGLSGNVLIFYIVPIQAVYPARAEWSTVRLKKDKEEVI